MNLLILDGPSIPGFSDPRYRGVRRDEPTYCDALPAHHETNRLFVDWYTVEGGDSLVMHDLHKAVRYATLCNKYLPGKQVATLRLC